MTETALGRLVTGTAASSGPTPMDALSAARRMWLTEQRIDMGVLAAVVGVSRATLYNWVGNREQLTAEVLWSLAAATIDEGKRRAKGSGAAYLAAVNEHYLQAIAVFEPVRRFIERDPEFALRVLTCNRTPFQARMIAVLRDMIDDQQAMAGYEPALDSETLAYVVVRTGESFIFNAFITGGDPDISKAIEACRVLFYAPPVSRRAPSTAERANRRRH